MPVIITARSKKLAFRWRRFAVIGIEALDREHQELLERLNELREHGKQGRPTPKTLLTGLVARFGQHFQEEEMRMLARGYAGFSPHFEAHQSFLEQLAAQVENSPPEQVDPDALLQWEAEHIARLDRPMAEFLLARS